MELKLTNTIGKLGLPITEVYNKERVKIYEAHDDLPPELQKSFRDMVFESKEKFISLLESIQTGE